MSNVEDTFRCNIIQMIGLTSASPFSSCSRTTLNHSAEASLPHMKRGSNIINTTSVTAYKGSAAMLFVTAPLTSINRTQFLRTTQGLLGDEGRHLHFHALPSAAAPP